MPLSAAFFTPHSSARKPPIPNLATEPSLDRIVLNVTDHTLLPSRIAYPALKIIPLPKRTGSVQQPVCLSCTGNLDSRNNAGEFNQRTQQDMNVVRHDNPTPQLIKALSLSHEDGSRYGQGNIASDQPSRAASRSVKHPIQTNKGDPVLPKGDAAISRLFPSHQQRTSQTPSKKTRNLSSLPVRQMRMSKCHADKVAISQRNSHQSGKRRG